MAHVDRVALLPVEATYGTPLVLQRRYPILPAEMRMVIASTREQTRLHDVTLYVFNQKGEVALIRKHGYPPGAWRAPGGGVHPGEPVASGAIREALEETGLRVDLRRYLLRVHLIFTCEGEEQPWTTHVLTAQTHDTELRTNDPKEIESVRFGTLAELSDTVGPLFRATGRGLLAYRADLHDEVAALLRTGG